MNCNTGSFLFSANNTRLFEVFHKTDQLLSRTARMTFIPRNLPLDVEFNNGRRGHDAGRDSQNLRAGIRLLQPLFPDGFLSPTSPFQRAFLKLLSATFKPNQP